MRDLAPTRCPAHLCLPVSLSPSLPLFPLALPPPACPVRAPIISLFLVPAPGAVYHVFSILSLRRAISGPVYTVPRNYVCELRRRKMRRGASANAYPGQAFTLNYERSRTNGLFANREKSISIFDSISLSGTPLK